jgi:hypothetical protein
MPARREGIPLDRLRDAVEGGVANSSLRSVAREVGMSPSGLQKFRDGAQPYAATRLKLERWYVREAAQYGRGPGTGSALAALQILTHDFPSSQQKQVTGEILGVLEAAYHRRRLRPPGWLVELRRTLAPGGE